MTRSENNSFGALRTLSVNDKSYEYFSVTELTRQGLGDVGQLPFSLRILLENLLRWEDGETVARADIEALLAWPQTRSSQREIAFRPARVLMQDFTGVPGMVDLAAMRDALAAAGGNPRRINPQTPVDLVIDHSVMVDHYGNPTAFADNVALEVQRNRERYAFLRWGQQALDNFRVVPPGTGICHQVNLEYLAQGMFTAEHKGTAMVCPDTLVGTDSHTTMINGLGVLGWGVGGIEAEAAMLGQPLSMLIPEVIGVRLTGQLAAGVTATDLVLTITEMLRKQGVVGKFVEFVGEGLNHLTLADRATIANMAPEYGATCGFFPIDQRTLEYLRLSGRDEHSIQLTETAAQAMALWREDGQPEPVFTDTLSLDLGSVVPSLAGPKRPQDRVALTDVRTVFEQTLESAGIEPAPATTDTARHSLTHGDVVIAAITSCTNTSNPGVMLAAALLAKNARQRGLQRKPWVKTSLAPGSRVVTEYLKATGLQAPLDALGFNLVGYGCTTCIGNSGPLAEDIEAAIARDNLQVASVLSGNRNFEGRIHQSVRTNWLASPPLVVAYALAGTVRIDLSRDPLGTDDAGEPVYLEDIWPSAEQIQQALTSVTGGLFRTEYASVFDGDESWQSLPVEDALTYPWAAQSTYIRHPPFFEGLNAQVPPVEPVRGARILALLGDSITTDHISPAGAIQANSPAGHYLKGQGIEPIDFNSYGSRRGNHEVMMRGTFANVRIRNEMVPDVEGGYTRHLPANEVLPIYGAAMRYQSEGVPVVIIAGKEYGTGSSRDWAAKGTRLLGIRAVIAESYERIHRSNLVGMGVLPLQFPEGVNRQTLKLDGSEIIHIPELDDQLKPGQEVRVDIQRAQGTESITTLCRIDTAMELQYYRHGGILHFVLREMLSAK